MMTNGWSGPWSAGDWMWMVIGLLAASTMTMAGIALAVRSVRRGGDRGGGASVGAGFIPDAAAAQIDGGRRHGVGVGSYSRLQSDIGARCRARSRTAVGART